MTDDNSKQEGDLERELQRPDRIMPPKPRGAPQDPPQGLSRDQICYGDIDLMYEYLGHGQWLPK